VQNTLGGTKYQQQDMTIRLEVGAGQCSFMILLGDALFKT
jgi:hypothetical protein